MLDISQWRISIGLWHCCHIPCNAIKRAVNVTEWVESLLCSENGGVKNLVLSLIMFLLLLLILSGDVELNPGPLTDISNVLQEKPGHYDLLHLLADMKNSWPDIGLALRVSSDYLDGLSRSPDTPSTILSNVIKKWLNSQSSPVNWKTLISAIEGRIVDNKRKGDEIRAYLDLTNLLCRYGLQYEELEKECDDGLIIAVSQNIDDYIKVGRGLVLSIETLESISQDYNNDIRRKNAVLWAWKIKNGNDATYLELVKAFMKMTDRFLIESVLKYVSEKNTPGQTETTVHLTPEMAKDRYPNWKDLTDSQKEAERNKLMDKNRDVRNAYTACVSRLIDSFSTRKVEPMHIRSLANCYSGRQLFPDVVESNNDSIATVFCILTGHCTWFNYEIIQVIVNNIGNDDEKTYLETYEKKHLIPYLNHSLYEIPCCPSNDQSRTNLLFKVPVELTGNEVKSIQRNLAKLLGIEDSVTLHFEDYNIGCIELVFSLPTVVLENTPKFQPFIEWEESIQSYNIKVNLVTVISMSEKPEVSILHKLLQKKDEQIVSTFEEKRISESQEKIARQQKMLTSLNFQLVEKDDMIKELETQLKAT